MLASCERRDTGPINKIRCSQQNQRANTSHALQKYLMYEAAKLARRPRVFPLASMIYHRLLTLAASADVG
jgi:hypothetical protein